MKMLDAFGVWLDAHNGSAIAVLTFVLALVTAWYAISAARQTRELKAARLAAVEPYVRLASSETTWRGVETKRTPTGGSVHVTQALRVNLRLVNLGPGPAMHVHSALVGLPFALAYSEYPKPLHIAGTAPLARPETSLVLEFAATESRLLVASFPSEVLVRLTYTDLVDRHWKTCVKVRLTKPANGEFAPVFVEVLEGETRSLIR